jgi:hypothetical protein
MFERVSFPEDEPIVASVEVLTEEPPVIEDGMTEFEDGSFGYEDVEPEVVDVGFNGNVALMMDDAELMSIGTQLLSEIDADIQSRKDWDDGYRKGLNLLGMKTEEMTTPWPGACGLFHTMVAEAVVRFQSNAIMEIFPPSGPAKANIIGKIDADKEKQAARVVAEFNYQLVERMDDYRDETEKLLFGLASCGSAFRKLYPDPVTGRPCARYVPAEKFIVPYGATSLKQAQRYTECFTLVKNELRKLQSVKFYRDIQPDWSMPVQNELQEKKDEINREDPPPFIEDQIDLYECHVDLDFEDPEGVARPYIVTLDKSGVVLSIYRNWAENDQYFEKIPWYVGYSYVPGLGFYGYGLLHLIGASAKAATLIMRQLIDAGTLSNLPGGLKAKGLRMKGDSSPIRPGEWREAEVSGMKLSESFLPLPYKEPSTVLLALLQNVVEEGRKLGSIADVEIGDVGANAPVGTTLAIMDRALKVMSAVQARLHNSMRLEFRILGRLIKDSTRDEYDYEVDGPREIKRSDFDDRIDILPVSDPNAATLPQRVTQYQSAIQMSSTAPQIYNLPLLHRKMLEVLGIRDADKIVPDKDEIPALDQVSENQRLVAMEPVKVYEWQPHEQHMVILESFLKDPQTAAALGQNPNANAIFAAAQAHYALHYGFKYRQDMARELGVPLPSADEPMPPEIEQNIAPAIAEAARRLTAKNQAEAAQAEAQAKLQDPVIQMQMQDAATKAKAVEVKAQQVQTEAQVELQKSQIQAATERERIKSQERIASESAIDKQEQFLAQLKLDHERMQLETQRTLAQVAEILARIEQAGGERESQS